MSRPLQAVIFDFDGVIANSEPLHLMAYQQLLADSAIELTTAEYYSKYLGYDDRGVFDALSRDRGLQWSDAEIDALIERKGRRMQDILHSGSVLFPGAVDFIRDAAAAVPIAIASGAQHHEILEIVEGAGLRDVFSAIVASGDTPESKPSPAPYRLAFERLCAVSAMELDPRRSVAIEDSHWGLESAKAAGLRLVGLTNTYPAHELVSAELVVDGLHALTLAALDRLCAR
jgi:beta-phosphoglucomutase